MGGCANAGGYIFVKLGISRTIAFTSSLSFVRRGDHKHPVRVSTIDRQFQRWPARGEYRQSSLMLQTSWTSHLNIAFTRYRFAPAKENLLYCSWRASNKVTWLSYYQESSPRLRSLDWVHHWHRSGIYTWDLSYSIMGAIEADVKPFLEGRRYQW